jgi:hypothetical protein
MSRPIGLDTLRARLAVGNDGDVSQCGAQTLRALKPARRLTPGDKKEKVRLQGRLHRPASPRGKAPLPVSPASSLPPPFVQLAKLATASPSARRPAATSAQVPQLGGALAWARLSSSLWGR